MSVLGASTLVLEMGYFDHFRWPLPKPKPTRTYSLVWGAICVGKRAILLSRAAGFARCWLCSAFSEGGGCGFLNENPRSLSDLSQRPKPGPLDLGTRLDICPVCRFSPKTQFLYVGCLDYGFKPVLLGLGKILLFLPHNLFQSGK